MAVKYKAHMLKTPGEGFISKNSKDVVIFHLLLAQVERSFNLQILHI